MALLYLAGELSIAGDAWENFHRHQGNRRTGRRISILKANARYWAKILSVLTLGVGFLMAGFTRRKQALHDFVAGTLVVRG